MPRRRARAHLRLLRLALRNVDDAEEGDDEEQREGAQQVEHRVGDGEEQAALGELRRLGA